MHEAYNLRPLLKLPLTIESMASWGDHLFVGTRQGHLLMYHINTGHGEPSVQLLRSNKYFSKKPIVQLAVVPEYSIIVALTDNVVSVHDIDLAVTNFPLISQVTKTKGTNLFSLDVVRTQTLTGESAAVVRMVVAVRRKLQFYYWKNRKFHEYWEDVSVPDVPKSLAWCKETICVGFRGEYALFRLMGQKFDELFPTGRSQDPKVVLMEDERFALGKDDQTTFITCDGKMSLQAVQWSETPLDMVHDQPYLLGVLSKSVEIRTEEPRLLIQSIELAKPRLISRGRQGRIFCSSQNQVWFLSVVPVSEQVPQLLRDKQFELAVMVANTVPEQPSTSDPLTTAEPSSPTSKHRTILRIRTLFAFDLFCQSNKFKDSLDIFYDLGIDPSHVIGLYDGLLPPEFQEKLSYPDTPPSLQGRQLEDALLALIEFLTQVRHKLNGLQRQAQLAHEPMVEGVIVIKAKKQALQIIDTTLLKCYIKTNDALVASLLRLKDNHCHLEEAERVLLKNRKMTELVILYNNRGLHRKALQLLQKTAEEAEQQQGAGNSFSSSSSSSSSFNNQPLRPSPGHEKIITYLQNLGSEHIDLILEFSQPLLARYPEEGFLIFTEDSDTVENLPRSRVLEFLVRNNPELVIPYLEHLILVWSETGTHFHNSLILQYKDLIMREFTEGDLPDGTNTQLTRKKLMQLLTGDPCRYDPPLVLSQFPYTHLHEERAILLGGAGRLREALIIYIHILHNLEAALAYCDRVSLISSGVYQELVTLIVQPPIQSELARFDLQGGGRSPDLESAISILEKHGSSMDLVAVLKSLPATAQLSRLTAFLTTAIQAEVSRRNETGVVRGLHHSEHIQVEEERIAVQATKVPLSEFTFCSVCDKRFSQLSAFVRFPDGSVAHYSCAFDKTS